jgi:hypothetical protein
LEEALTAQRELEQLRVQAATVLTRQKDVMARLRDSATRTSRILWAYSNGDAVPLLEAGLDLEKSRRVRTGPPGVPTELRVRELDGSITLLWRNPMRRSWFRIQIAEGQPSEENWQSHNDLGCAKGRFTFTGLKPHTAYWFRVKAFNANGESPWSNFVCGRPL